MVQNNGRVSHLELQHEQNKLNKKMGYLVSDAEMTTLWDTKKSGSKSLERSEYNQDSSYFSGLGGQGYDALAPNATEEVKTAWVAAANALGISDFKGTNSVYISSLYAMQTELKNSTGSTDLLGSTKESAVYAVKKALERMDSQSGIVNTKVQQYRQVERAFYQAFLNELQG